MAYELIPSEAQTNKLKAFNDSIEFFLFSTDSEDSVSSSSPTSISDEIDNLNRQFRCQRLRKQRAEADKTLIQILCTYTTQHSEMVLDSLKRLQLMYSSCTLAFAEVIENSAWTMFLYMRENQIDSPLILNLICRYADFLEVFGEQIISKEKFTIITDFLSHRGDRFLVSILSTVVDKLDGTVELNLVAAATLGDITTLLRNNTISSADRCWAYAKILDTCNRYLPTQTKVSEKLLKLALLECIQLRISYNRCWCVYSLHDTVTQRNSDGVADGNYESAEVIEMWFTNAIILAKGAVRIKASRPTNLRQYYQCD